MSVFCWLRHALIYVFIVGWKMPLFIILRLAEICNDLFLIVGWKMPLFIILLLAERCHYLFFIRGWKMPLFDLFLLAETCKKNVINNTNLYFYFCNLKSHCAKEKQNSAYLHMKFTASILTYWSTTLYYYIQIHYALICCVCFGVSQQF